MPDDLRQHGAALATGFIGQVLPIEQKPHEVLQRHRFDFPAQTLDGVAMDARQQVPFAPLFAVGPGAEVAAQHVAFLFQPSQGLSDVGGRQGQGRGDLGQGLRAEPTEPCAQYFREGVLRNPGLIETGQQRQVVGNDRLPDIQALHRHPQTVG